MKVNFILKDPNKETSSIQFKLLFNGKNIKRATGISIDSKTWNQKTQKVKRNNLNASTINQEIDRLKVEINDIYIKCKSKTHSQFVTELDKYLKRDYVSIDTLFDLFDLFIKERKKLNDYSSGTLKIYETTYSKLENLNIPKSEFLLENIGYNFFTEFINKYSSQGIQNITIHKYFRNIRKVMNWGLEKEYHQNYKFSLELSKVMKNYDFGSNSKFSLTKEQLAKIENYSFTNDSYTFYRDLFIIQTYLCLRYSELVQIRKDNIIGNEILLYSGKNKKKITKPIPPKIKVLIEKYEFDESSFISNQKYNLNLKKIFKVMDIDEEILVFKTMGKIHNKVKIPIYEIISNHIARNTYITISQEAGMSEKEIMEVSGHKNVKTLQGYVQTTQQRAFDKSREIWR